MQILAAYILVWYYEKKDDEAGVKKLKMKIRDSISKISIIAN